MKITLSVVIGVSLVIAAVAWAIPFEAPMVGSYWASGVGAPSSSPPSPFMESEGYGLPWGRHWLCGTPRLLLSSIASGADRTATVYWRKYGVFHMRPASLFLIWVTPKSPCCFSFPAQFNRP